MDDQGPRRRQARPLREALRDDRRRGARHGRRRRDPRPRADGGLPRPLPPGLPAPPRAEAAARRHPRAPRRVPRRHPLGPDEHPLRPGAGRRRDDGPRLLPAALAPQLHGRRARGRLRHRAALRARLRHPRRGRVPLPRRHPRDASSPTSRTARSAASSGSRPRTARVELDNPCLPHTGHSFREDIGGTFREYTVAGGTTYDYQLAAFLAAVDTGAPLATGGADAIGNMAALEAIYERAGVRRALTPA